jgi:hypothetical protein
VSIKTARRILWIAFLVALPVPFLGVGMGVAPPLRMLFLGSLVSLVYLQDPDYLSQVIGSLLLGQGIAWSALLYGVARFAARAIGRIDASGARAAVVLVLVACLLTASLFPIYRTPFSSSGARSSLLQVFD